MITVTPVAAEQIKKSAQNADCANLPLRIAVVSGGCSGNQYRLGFDEQGEGDTKFESNGINVIVDTGSLPLVKGLELDFVDDLQGSSFVFKNPNAHGGCGCGKSFSC